MLASALAGILFYAAWGDLRTRTIPNWLNAAIVLAAPAWWWAGGMAPWPDMAVQLGLALAVFALFTVLFALGMMGGGDVKLIAALALWLPLTALLTMLFVMAVAGGLVTIVILVAHRAARRPGPPEVPYGVAIAFAGLWVIANDILTVSVH